MREGAKLDRTISVTSIRATSAPEIASAVLLSAVSAFWLGILPGTSAMGDGLDLRQPALPVMALVPFDVGDVARRTRASRAEAMTPHFIRSAALEGRPKRGRS